MMSFEDEEEQFLEGADTPPAGPSPEERRQRREIMERRSGQDLQKKWQQGDRQALAAAENLAAPPIVQEPRCHVCTSEHRVWIERKLVQGHTYKSIAESIPNGSVSRKSVSEHWKKHMALDQAAVRAMLEEEAGALGQNVEEGVRGAFTLRGSLEVLIRKGFQDALDGVTTIEPRDLTQMMRALNELNANAGTAATEEAKMAIGIFKEAIQSVLIKGDIIERELGVRLLSAISEEVMRLRDEQAADAMLDRHLTLPSGEAQPRLGG